MTEQIEQTPSTEQPPATAPAPRYGVGSLVDHLQLGRGRVVAYEGNQYCVMFRGGDVKRVAFSFDGLLPVQTQGDPQLDRIKQAVAEVLGDHGWLDADLEMAKRWAGGTVSLIPGNDSAPRDIPIEAFFKKIIGIRDKLRVLEQKINGHKTLTEAEKVELQGYITRSYGSLTTFNALFADKASHFKGQSSKSD